MAMEDKMELLIRMEDCRLGMLQIKKLKVVLFELIYFGVVLPIPRKNKFSQLQYNDALLHMIALSLML